LSAADEIAKLGELRDSGNITPEEFESAKKKLLGGASSNVAPRPSSPRRKSNRQKTKVGTWIALAIIVAFFAGLVIFAMTSSKTTISFTVAPQSVKPLNANLIRVFIRWNNTGSTAGSDTCVMDTEVHNQFGDLVNTEVNSVGTNGDVQPEQIQVVYQDIGVNAGDSRFITIGDITFSGC
jgi:hypothetical protein